MMSLRIEIELTGEIKSNFYMKIKLNTVNRIAHSLELLDIKTHHKDKRRASRKVSLP
jgi:hypothetical protein